MSPACLLTYLLACSTSTTLHYCQYQAPTGTFTQGRRVGQDATCLLACPVPVPSSVRTDRTGCDKSDKSSQQPTYLGRHLPTMQLGSPPRVRTIYRPPTSPRWRTDLLDEERTPLRPKKLPSCIISWPVQRLVQGPSRPQPSSACCTLHAFPRTGHPPSSPSVPLDKPRSASQRLNANLPTYVTGLVSSPPRHRRN
ncbi:uncharacterized protein LY79DRAFT_261444 [Colletotrichum navitas]|uniref:Secreted protein n=1 Tax=Colletotrichum navitas TaxID=681940 RepID=A0AAD8V3G9_9PEZI|nr:uncharacterized protein LY79DRAFT_261444 [Colletotrichum navitas]KAK1585817.1 hypothetical protein LY79DRAFT_261444 [Colletotrichum navitas]